MDKKDQARKNNLLGGLILILVGAVALAAQFFQSEWLGPAILFALAGAFILWGIFTRESGFFIPGGVLAGVGLGISVVLAPSLDLSDDATGGAFMLAFSLGWALIPLLSIIFTQERHLWALIPGGIMALIGAALVFGGAAWDALAFLGKIWPLFLIIGGIYILLKRDGHEKQLENDAVEEF